MYLSRVEIDVKNRYKTKELTHLGAFHNWVEQSFPAEVAAGKRPRHLWRIDQLAGKKYLLVLSEAAPDLEQLTQYGVPKTAVTKPYDRWLESIHEGQILRFRLTANPTRSISRPGARQGRVVPHITVDQQRKWLIDRADGLGFQLVEQQVVTGDEPQLAFDIVGREWPVLRRKAGRDVRLSRVTFEGLLRVADVPEFRRALTKGIGREKAFGMGLMTVIPAGER